MAFGTRVDTKTRAGTGSAPAKERFLETPDEQFLETPDGQEIEVPESEL